GLGVARTPVGPGITARTPGGGEALPPPCRDEAAFPRHTLESVVAQSAPPTLWLIVDDGSTDATPGILAEYAARFDFIRILRRNDRGRRSVGPGVIEAFYAGYDTIDPAQFDYLCKLDLDLEIPPRYFELLMQRMEGEPRLGTCSGQLYYRGRNGRLVSEACGHETSIGPSKFYRLECFLQIGGLVRGGGGGRVDWHRGPVVGWV